MLRIGTQYKLFQLIDNNMAFTSIKYLFVKGKTDASKQSNINNAKYVGDQLIIMLKKQKVSKVSRQKRYLTVSFILKFYRKSAPFQWIVSLHSTFIHI